MRTSPTNALAVFLLTGMLSLGGVVACGGMQLAPPPEFTIEDGPEIPLPGTRATMAVPKGMQRKDDQTFLLIHKDVAWLVLRIVVQALPEGDIDTWINRHVLLVERSGSAGILRNEPVTLGDLDGRLIAAEDLMGARRAAVIQVVAPAEDGVYVATFYGSAETIRPHNEALTRALLSLRVPQRGAAVGQKRANRKPQKARADGEAEYPAIEELEAAGQDKPAQ